MKPISVTESKNIQLGVNPFILDTFASTIILLYNKKIN